MYKQYPLFILEHAGYEMLVYIGSLKLTLAALLLSLVLLTILIVDFTFCRRQKGFFYALVGCAKDKDNACQISTGRTGSNRHDMTII